jgi:hypothetical protein
MNEYYVYALLDPRKPGVFKYDKINCIFNFQPYYIGKGSKNRVVRHFTELESSKRYNQIKYYKIKNIIKEGYDPKLYFVIINNNLEEKQALLLESEYIKILGRIDKKTGILSNLTDGGEDSSMMTSKLSGKSYEQIYGIKKANKLKNDKKIRFSGKNNPMYGKKCWLNGNHQTEETKKKISDQRKKPIKQLTLQGSLIKIWSSAIDAANELGISKSSIHNVTNPNMRAKTAAGYKWEYVDTKNIKYECDNSL